MTDWLERRLKSLEGMTPYNPPPVGSGLKMDSNENLAVPLNVQRDITQEASRNADIRQYPLGGAARLERALAAYLRMPKYMVSVGNGSDQILDVILSCLADKDTSILAPEPTFQFFVDRCHLHGIPLIRVPYESDMTLDMDRIIEASVDADIIYIDSPNNPTGHQISRTDIQRLARTFEGPIIIDEAYADFGDYTAYRMIRRYPHMIIIRTLSKSFGLAGLRVGYMVSGRRISDVFGHILQYPYPISSISIEAAILALSRRQDMESTWGVIRAERDRVIHSLRQYGLFRVYDSKANFVLFDAGGADDRIHKALSEQGIMIRKIGRVGAAEGCLRVTLGTHEMNSRFLLAIRDLLK